MDTDVTSAIPPETPAQGLDYAQAPAWHRTAKAKRAATALIVVGVLVVAALWAPSGWRMLRISHYQRQCLRYQRPPDAVACSISAGDVMTPSLGSISSEVPPAWVNLYAGISPPGFRSQGTIFLHARRARDGNGARLIAVDVVDPDALLGRSCSVEVRVLQPASLGRTPREIWSNQQPLLNYDAGPCTLYAGQPDPSDESHFTFDVDANGRRQTFDGWLRENDTLIIEPR
jgi:hypothetical protein